MPRYRKLPIEIDAIVFEYSTEGIKALQEFAGREVATSKGRHPGATGLALIFTLEGPLEASEGDYIIRGVAGEYYPCKPDIFKQTYEAV